VGGSPLEKAYRAMREEPLGWRWKEKNTGDRLWDVGFREREKGQSKRQKKIGYRLQAVGCREKAEGTNVNTQS